MILLNHIYTLLTGSINTECLVEWQNCVFIHFHQKPSLDNLYLPSFRGLDMSQWYMIVYTWVILFDKLRNHFSLVFIWGWLNERLKILSHYILQLEKKINTSYLMGRQHCNQIKCTNLCQLQQLSKLNQ